MPPSPETWKKYTVTTQEIHRLFLLSKFHFQIPFGFDDHCLIVADGGGDVQRKQYASMRVHEIRHDGSNEILLYTERRTLWSVGSNFCSTRPPLIEEDSECREPHHSPSCLDSTLVSNFVNQRVKNFVITHGSGSQFACRSERKESDDKDSFHLEVFPSWMLLRLNFLLK